MAWFNYVTRNGTHTEIMMILFEVPSPAPQETKSQIDSRPNAIQIRLGKNAAPICHKHVVWRWSNDEGIGNHFAQAWIYNRSHGCGPKDTQVSEGRGPRELKGSQLATHKWETTSTTFHGRRLIENMYHHVIDLIGKAEQDRTVIRSCYITFRGGGDGTGHNKPTNSFVRWCTGRAIRKDAR